jgi:uncharacterized protein YndB with AHSA1/START domain
MQKTIITNISAPPGTKEIIITSVFDAPRELVFKAITDPNLVPQWWGPKTYTTVVDKMDVHPGGVWRYINRDAEGKEFAFSGVYKEVAPPSRLSYTFNFEPVPGHESLETVTFEEMPDGKTKMVDTDSFRSVEDRDGMLKSGVETGAVESMSRFAEVLERLKKESAKELVITRVFNAPVELAWKAWTKPERVKQWWGPKGFTAPFAKIDFRVGGKYLNSMRSPDGKDFWSTGVYEEIVPLKRIVVTDSFADEKGNVVSAAYYGMSATFPLELLITVTFEEVDGKTKMTLQHSGIKGLSDADFSNMRQGWEESFDKLDVYLKTVQVLTIA